MTSPRVLFPVLQGVTVTALAMAAALLAWPAHVQVVPVDPVVPSLAAPQPVAPSAAATLTDSIVNANVFALTREAPDDRTFAAAPSDAGVPEVTAGEYDADAGIAEGAIATDAEPVPALYGVVNGPTGRAALLRLDPGTTAARLYHLGDGAHGYRLRSIGTDRVELSGPTGAIVLELVAKGGTP